MRLIIVGMEIFDQQGARSAAKQSITLQELTCGSKSGACQSGVQSPHQGDLQKRGGGQTTTQVCYV